MEAHPPEEEDHRGEKHYVEDEMFVHLHSKQFGVGSVILSKAKDLSEL
jgi:hypothetical protein